MTVTFEPLMQFLNPFRFIISKTYARQSIYGCFVWRWHKTAVEQRMTDLLNLLFNDNGVCKAVPGFARGWMNKLYIDIFSLPI